MKNILSVFTVFVFGAYFLFSCNKVEPTTSTSNFMKANVDSINFFNATNSSVSASLANNQLTITGISASAVTIHMSIYGYTGFQGSTLLDGTLGTASIDSGSGHTLTNSVSGIIAITNTYPYLKGTFWFICADASKVSQGTFTCIAPAP